MAEASLNTTPQLNQIYATLQAAMPTVPIYFPHNQLPEPPPPAFYSIRNLPGTIEEDWGTRRTGLQRVQVLCVATGGGTLRSMAEAVLTLPEHEFGVIATGSEFWNGTHYEVPVTVEYEL